MSGILTWFALAKGVLTEPREFFDLLQVEGYAIPLTFSLLSVSIAAYFGAGVHLLQHPPLWNSPLDILFLLIKATVLGLFGGIGGTLAWSGLLYAPIRTVTNASFHDTVTVVAYTTPVVTVLGWMPVLQLLVPLPLIYLQSIGIQERHGLDENRAIGLSLFPHLLLIVILGSLWWNDPALVQQVLRLPDHVALIIFQLVL